MPGKAFFLFRQGGRLSPAGGGVGGGVALLRGWEFEGRHNRQLRKKRSHVGRALPAIYLKMKGAVCMVALRLLGIGNVAAGVASCRSRLVQSVVRVKPALSPIEGQSAPNRQPPLSPFSKGELNRMAGRLRRERSVERLCRTFRLLSLFFILIVPSVFLADTADAAWGTATVDSAGDTGRYTSIAVGTSGAAYISYYDATNGNLMYATTATPTVTTGAASNVTTNSATLAGTVNGRGLSTISANLFY